ncbi:MAG: hypothetical protein A2063_06515 [Gallionellales bacterium GWA2_60_142]|jgi:hypothetical protein|nr:MAG: hypothetical protein A2063_06515 [Gallionellales bacterium GWA2_60_142]HCI13127.1 DUF2062 domain-containing protein [Gallionellaceae bacterium]
MRKFFHRFHSKSDAIRHHRWLKPFAGWLHHPDLWHLHRRSVAGGVAVGLFCGMIPGPIQMISAVLLAVLLRVNLPLAAVVTAYTNPFTIVPLYLLAYELGRFVLGVSNSIVAEPPPFPAMHWDSWAGALWQWMAALGKPLLLGLPLLALSLSLAGYLLVRIVWRLAVVWRWRARANRYAQKKAPGSKKGPGAMS